MADKERKARAGTGHASVREGGVLDGRYQLGRLLRVGALEALFEATVLGSERRMLVKLDRAEREAELAERDLEQATNVFDPHIAHLREHGKTDGGFRFLVYDDVAEGRALVDVMAAEGTLAPIRVAHLGRQIAKALAAAHAAGLCHHRLSSAGVFLGEFGSDSDHVRVAELGSPLPRGVWLEDGATIGDVAYIAPEQANEERGDERSDLYSLGVLLFEMLLGRLPFSARTARELALQHILEPAPTVWSASLSGEQSSLWNALLARLLTKDPASRPASAQEAAEELRELRETLRRLGPATGREKYKSATIDLGGVLRMLEGLEDRPEAPDKAQGEPVEEADEHEPEAPNEERTRSWWRRMFSR